MMRVLKWNDLVEIKATDITQEEREVLCENIVNCSVHPDATHTDLKNVFNVVQLLLIFRNAQVDSLQREMDSMATKHLEIKEQLQQEISQLQLEAISGSKKSRRGSEAKQEAAKLHKQNQELQFALESIKGQLINGQILGHDEEAEAKAEMEQEKLNKTVQLQSGHISKLLADIESSEAENCVLRDRLASLRDNLAEATGSLCDITTELNSVKNLCVEYKGRCCEVESECTALRRQVSELVEQRSQLDHQLQDFQQDVDSRVERWKGAMVEKDSEIEDLRMKLSVCQPDQLSHLHNTVSALTQALATREQQVDELSMKLQEATQELADCATTLEQLKLDKGGGKSRRLWQQLQKAVTRERTLEKRLRDAENDAKSRAEEVMILSNENQRFEMGELGLAEALSENRELKKSLSLRDRDIQNLVTTSNEVQNKLDEIADQNIVLRERLGMSRDIEIDVSGVSNFRSSQRLKSEALLKQVATLEAEVLKLKLENRDYIRRFKSEGLSLENIIEEPAEPQELQAELQAVLEENESLRKGMHEILECVRAQDGTSDIKVESTCLERLLEALDSRHVAGWYHPAMRLQAQLFATQGVAAELREQLRIARGQQIFLPQAVQNIYSQDVKASSVDDHDTKTDTPIKSPPKPIGDSKKAEGGEWSQNMRSQICDFGNLLSELCHCMSLFGASCEEEKNDISTQLEDCKAEIEELRRHLDEGTHSVAVCAARAASQRLAERAALRKCHSLEASRDRLDQDNLVIRKRAIAKEAGLEDQLIQSNKHKDELHATVLKLQRELSLSVPQSEFQHIYAEFTNVSNKLRDLLLEQDKWGPGNSKMQEIQNKLAHSEELAFSLTAELIKTKTILKNYEHQSVRSVDEEVAALTNRLATAEVSEETLKKKIEHSEKINTLLQEQVSELEARNCQLEKSILSQLSTSLAVQELLPTQPPALMQVDEVRCARLEESISAAQSQVSALQNLVDSRHSELEMLRQQTLQLQSEGDLQATLGRMNEELLALKLSETTAQSDMLEAQRITSELQAKCCSLEKQLKAGILSTQHFVEEAHNKERVLLEMLYNICIRHSSCTPLNCLDITTNWLRQARQDEYEARLAQIKSWCEAREAQDKLAVIKLINETPDINKDVHTSTLQVKIKLLESQRHSEKLAEQLHESRERLSRLENHSCKLEDQILQLEKDLEKQYIILEMERCEHALGKDRNASITVQDPLTLVDVDFEEKMDVEKTVYQEKRFSIDKKDSKESLVQENEGKQDVLIQEKRDIEKPQICLQCRKLSNDLAISNTEIQQLKSQLILSSNEVQSSQGNTTKVALEAMISSLSELVSLKEEALTRARQRLKEIHKEHAQVTRALRLQASELQVALARCEASKSQPTETHSSGPAVTSLLTQVHELEDQMRVSNRNAGILAGQLRTATDEMNRWKDLAQTRQARLQQLQDRYETELQEAITSRPSAWQEKGEIEVAEKDEDIQPELLKSKMELRSLRDLLLHTQTELKFSKKQQSELAKKKEEISSEVKTPPPRDEKLSRSLREEKVAKEARAVQEKLRTQIKQLQSELEEVKAREQSNLETHKSKASENISRWDERKRLQGSCEKLRLKLQETEAGAAKLKQSNEAMRSLIERLERERLQLETQLQKKSRPISASASVSRLEDELSRTRSRLHTSEESCSVLRRQLEHQRKLAEEGARVRDELSVLRRDLELERETSLNLQGRNTRLEAANLELNLKIETLQNEVQTQGEERMPQSELERSVLVLGRHVQKLQAKIREYQSSGSLDGSVDSSNNGSISAQLQATLKRKSSLERENSGLKSENNDLSTRLEQKVRVLVEVRAALQEASLREATLRAEVARLRNVLSRGH